MLALSRPTQWWLIAVSYAAVTVYSGILIYDRYRMYAANAQDAAAAAGMYAWGDEMLLLFVCFLFLLPTIFLLRLLSSYESTYEIYSRVLLVISLTAPLCLVWLFAADPLKTKVLQDFSILRIFRSPFLLVLFAVSRWMARTRPAKRWTNYALVTETGALVLAIASLFLPSKGAH